MHSRLRHAVGSSSRVRKQVTTQEAVTDQQQRPSRDTQEYATHDEKGV